MKSAKDGAGLALRQAIRTVRKSVLMKIEPATVITVFSVFSIAVAELASNGVTMDQLEPPVELRLERQLHLRRRRGGLSVCRSLRAVPANAHATPAAFAVFAHIVKIQSTRWTFAIPDIGKIGLADEFGAGRSYPEQKILRLTYLVSCRQGSRLGRAVVFGRRRRYLHRQRSATEYRIYSCDEGISGLHSITPCHRFDELSERVSEFMDIVQRLCLFNRLRFTLKHV
jgi:hypothetical protein